MRISGLSGNHSLDVLTTLRAPSGKNLVARHGAVVFAVSKRKNQRVLEGRCPNLLAEAGLYRWASRGESGADAESPLDEHNHALAALRYLVSRLDAHRRALPAAAGGARSAAG